MFKKLLFLLTRNNNYYYFTQPIIIIIIKEKGERKVDRNKNHEVGKPVGTYLDHLHSEFKSARGHQSPTAQVEANVFRGETIPQRIPPFKWQQSQNHLKTRSQTWQQQVTPFLHRNP